MIFAVLLLLCCEMIGSTLLLMTCAHHYTVHLSSFNLSVCMTYETGSQDIQQNNTSEPHSIATIHCSSLHDFTIVVVNYTLQVDPQLIQAGLPNRVDLRMAGQSSGSGSTIKDSIILMQGGGSRCISAQAVVVIVRIYVV